MRDEPVGMDRRFNRYRWYGGQRTGVMHRNLPDRMLFESPDTGDVSMLTQRRGRRRGARVS